ncbi:MAG: poly-beta-1,6-N-acetyl-D-glucosamine biosynthesis protein PgaD [Ruminococcus sp.]|nr:poly-beta-1,6-N-acetyl-D-glucosamine biosynthesis protein PgaD [Ruminococcus sp.]
MNENKNMPLNQKSEYNFEEHLIYGRQKRWKKIIELLFTVIGWLFIVSFVAYYVYGNITLKSGKEPFEFLFFNKGMLKDLNNYYFIAFVALLILTVLLIVWKNYNYYRFGRLRRRKFRPAVNNDEICEMFELDKTFVEKMQNDRYVLLENNIIPEDMGIIISDKDKEKESKKEIVKV